MYSKASWGGSVDPFIMTNFDNSSYKGGADAIVSFVIFEWRDEHLLGIQVNPNDASVRSITIKYDHCIHAETDIPTERNHMLR